MLKFKIVILFLVAWIAADIFWNTVLGMGLIHKADNPAAQGLATVT